MSLPKLPKIDFKQEPVAIHLESTMATVPSWLKSFIKHFCFYLFYRQRWITYRYQLILHSLPKQMKKKKKKKKVDLKYNTFLNIHHNSAPQYSYVQRMLTRTVQHKNFLGYKFNGIQYGITYIWWSLSAVLFWYLLYQESAALKTWLLISPCMFFFNVILIQYVRTLWFTEAPSLLGGCIIQKWVHTLICIDSAHTLVGEKNMPVLDCLDPD